MLLDLAALASRTGTRLRRASSHASSDDRRGAPSSAFHLDWQRARSNGETFFRLDHPARRTTIDQAAARRCLRRRSLRLRARTRARWSAYRWSERVARSQQAHATRPLAASEEYLVVAAWTLTGDRVARTSPAKFFSLRGERRRCAGDGALPVLGAAVTSRHCGPAWPTLETRNE